jgi:hypothetical protein
VALAARVNLAFRRVDLVLAVLIGHPGGCYDRLPMRLRTGRCRRSLLGARGTIVTVPRPVASKLALHEAMVRGMSNVELGRRLGADEKAISACVIRCMAAESRLSRRRCGLWTSDWTSLCARWHSPTGNAPAAAWRCACGLNEVVRAT